MITHYEIYCTDENGQFVRAPNPPPPEWRERKGVCRHCGEKVFVKAGPLRSFWTHGKGKTCVKKANRVDEAITAAEEYARNRGALSAGDEALKAGFEEQIGSDAKRLAEIQEICGEQQPGTVPVAPVASTPIRSYAPSQLPRTLTQEQVGAPDGKRKKAKDRLYSDEESERIWQQNYADYWKSHIAQKRSAWRR